MAMVVAGQAGLAQEMPGENLAIRVRLYDYARVEPGDLARAQDEAARVLRRAGVGTVWLDCSGSEAGAGGDAACRGRLQATDLILRILPRAMAERAPRSKDSLGFAQQSTDGAPAYVASVFQHRVEERAKELDSSPRVILGYALAHEIGHLLLGTNSHSPIGIMRAAWTENELRLASRGSFSFQAQEATRISAEVAARSRVERDRQLSLAQASD